MTKGDCYITYSVAVTGYWVRVWDADGCIYMCDTYSHLYDLEVLAPDYKWTPLSDTLRKCAKETALELAALFGVPETAIKEVEE